MTFDSIGSTDLRNVQYRKPEIDRITFALTGHNYIQVENPKDLIVIHNTAGTTAAGAIEHWETDPRRIATAYIVDIDGRIYQTFPPQFWAYALGKGVPATNDQRAIQIEIVNRGPLVRRGDNLCWWPSNFTTPFCTVGDENHYTEKLWRGYGFWTHYPQGQLRAVFSLVCYLCERFNIPKDIPMEKIREAEVEFFNKHKGVCGHDNFRPDKVDPGPAFPWEELNAFLAMK